MVLHGQRRGRGADRADGPAEGTLTLNVLEGADLLAGIPVSAAPKAKVGLSRLFAANSASAKGGLVQCGALHVSAKLLVAGEGDSGRASANTGTKIVEATDPRQSAVWNEEFLFDGVATFMNMRIEVFDKFNVVGEETCSAGWVLVPVSRLPKDEPVEQWYQLKPPIGSDQTLIKTAVRLRLCFRAANKVASKGRRLTASLSPNPPADRSMSAGRRDSSGRLVLSSPPRQERGLDKTDDHLAGMTKGGGGGGAQDDGDGNRDEDREDDKGDVPSPLRQLSYGFRNVEGAFEGALDDGVDLQAGAEALPNQSKTGMHTKDMAGWNGMYSRELIGDMEALVKEALPQGLVDYFLVIGPALNEQGGFQLANCYEGYGLNSNMMSDPALEEEVMAAWRAEGPGGPGLPPVTQLEVECGILESFPKEERNAEQPIPDMVEWFCFPGGCFLVSSPVCPRPSVSSYVRINAGVRSYGVTLTFFTKAFLVQSKGGESSGVGSRSSSISSNSGSEPDATPGDDEQQEKDTHFLWVPTCLCVLTHIPVIEELVEWLEGFFLFLTKEGANAGAGGASDRSSKELASRQASLDAAVFQLTMEVPLPVPGVCSMTIQCFEHYPPAQRRLAFRLPGVSSLPGLSFSLYTLLRSLRPRGVVDLLSAAMQESPIILHSSNMAMLAPVAEGLFGLLYPLQWPFLYVPILPRFFLNNVVESPQPFIIGVHTHWLADVPQSTMDRLVLVDLDSGFISGLEFCPLPRDISRRLVKVMQEMMCGAARFSSPLPMSALARTAKAKGPASLSMNSFSSAVGGGGGSNAPGSTSPQVLSATLAATVGEDAFNSRSSGALTLEGGGGGGGGQQQKKGGGEARRGLSATQLKKRERRRQEHDLRMVFVEAMAEMFLGYTECLFFVDAKRPIFNSQRFLQDFCKETYVPFLSHVIDTMAFQFLMENQDAPSLATFHRILERTRREAYKRNDASSGVSRRRSVALSLSTTTNGSDNQEGEDNNEDGSGSSDVTFELPGVVPADDKTPLARGSAGGFGLRKSTSGDDAAQENVEDEGTASPHASHAPNPGAQEPEGDAAGGGAVPEEAVREHASGSGAGAVSANVGTSPRRGSGEVGESPDSWAALTANSKAAVAAAERRGAVGVHMSRTKTVCDEQRLLVASGGTMRRRPLGASAGLRPSVSELPVGSSVSPRGSSGAGAAVVASPLNLTNSRSSGSEASRMISPRMAGRPVSPTFPQGSKRTDRKEYLEALHRCVFVPLETVGWAYEPLLSGEDWDMPAPRRWTLADVGAAVGQDLGLELTKQTKQIAQRKGKGAAQEAGLSIRSFIDVSMVTQAGQYGDESDIHDEDLTRLAKCIEAVFSGDRAPEQQIVAVERSLRENEAVQRRFLKMLRQAGKGGMGRSTGPIRLPGPAFDTVASFSYTLLCVCVEKSDFDTAHSLLQLTGAFCQLHEVDDDGEDGEADEGGGYFCEYLSGRIRRHSIFVDMSFWRHLLKHNVESDAKRVQLALDKSRKGKDLSPSEPFQHDASGQPVDDGSGSLRQRGKAYRTEEMRRRSMVPTTPGEPMTDAEEGERAGEELAEGMEEGDASLALPPFDDTPRRQSQDRDRGASDQAVREREAKEEAEVQAELVFRQAKILLHEMFAIGMGASSALAFVEDATDIMALPRPKQLKLQAIVNMIWEMTPNPRDMADEAGGGKAPSSPGVLGRRTHAFDAGGGDNSSSKRLSPRRQGSEQAALSPSKMFQSTIQAPPNKGDAPTTPTGRLRSSPDGKNAGDQSGAAAALQQRRLSPPRLVRTGVRTAGARNGSPVPSGGEDHNFSGPVLAMSATPTRLATASADGSIGIFELSSGAKIVQLLGHTRPVTQVYCGDDWVLSGSTDGSIRMWSLPPQSALDGNRRGFMSLLGGSSSSSLSKAQSGFPLAAVTKSRVMPGGHDGAVTGLTVLPADASGDHSAVAISAGLDNKVRLWSMDDCRCKVIFTGHEKPINTVTARENGEQRQMLSGSDDHTVRLWDVNEMTGCKALRKFVGHEQAVTVVHFLEPSRFTSVSGSNDRTLRLWDSRHKGAVAVLTGHVGPITCALIGRRDKTMLVSGAADKTAMVWDLRSTGSGPVHVLAGHSDRVTCVQEVNSKNIMTASEDSKVIEWDPSTGVCLAAHRDHSQGVTCSAVNDEVLATGAWDGSVLLWGRKRGKTSVGKGIGRTAKTLSHTHTLQKT